MESRRYRAGERIDDLCRACKLAREHTVMAVDGEGRVLRVVCGFCGSEHNYRGSGHVGQEAAQPAAAATTAALPGRPPAAAAGLAPKTAPLVSERERTGSRMSTNVD